MFVHHFANDRATRRKWNVYVGIHPQLNVDTDWIRQRAARAFVRVPAENLVVHARYTSEEAKSPPRRRSLGAGSWLRKKIKL